MLFLFLLMMPNTFFLVQAVAREYRLVGDTGSVAGYGGDATDLGDELWYDGRVGERRSEVWIRKALPVFVGVLGLRRYEVASSGAERLMLSALGVI